MRKLEAWVVELIHKEEYEKDIRSWGELTSEIALGFISKTEKHRIHIKDKNEIDL